MANSTRWYAAEATPGVAAFDPTHVLWQRLGAATRREKVATEWAETEVSVPNVPDRNLRRLIAYCAADSGHQFGKAQGVMSYIVAETLAQRWVELGGTPEAWCADLTAMGIEIAPQAGNLFISLLTWLYGDDTSRKLGKLAQFLHAWTLRYHPGPATHGANTSHDYGWPAPELYDDVPGSSDLVAWARARHNRGYVQIAKRHADWLRERDCQRCGHQYQVQGNANCPACNRPTDDAGVDQPDDIHIVGVVQHILKQSADGAIEDAEFEPVHKEHHKATLWRIERFEEIEGSDEWVQIGDDIYDDLAAAEAEAVRMRREQHLAGYSKSIEPSPTPGNRPGDGSLPTSASATPGTPKTGAHPSGGANPIDNEIRDTFDDGNAKPGELRIVALICDEDDLLDRSPWLAPDDPRANEWSILQSSGNDWRFFDPPDGADLLFKTLTAAESYLAEHCRNASAPDRNSKPKSQAKKPTFAIPRQQWPKGGKDADPPSGKQTTVVNLDAEQARREVEAHSAEYDRLRRSAEERAAELEKRLAATEADRDQWHTAAQANPAQWCDAPNDLAKAWAATDANKAIDFWEMLRDALYGTPEWRAYQDELWAQIANDHQERERKRAEERKAEINADPKERKIVTFKNTLELLLRTDKPGEQEAAAAGLLRLTGDGDLDFLDRLTDADREAPPPPQVTQIAQGSPIDWFLRRTTEQLRQDAEQEAEQHPDRLDELRSKISAFLNTLRKASEKVLA